MRHRPLYAFACGLILLTAASGVLSQPSPGPLTNVPSARQRAQVPATRIPPQPGAATPRPPGRPGQVDWAAAVGGARRQPGERFIAAGSTLDRAALDRIRLPVLLPHDEALVRQARLYAFDDYYSLNVDVPGATVEFSGSRAFVPVRPGAIARLKPQGPENVTVARTVDGRLLSFTRFGVLYTVEVRCDRAQDQRCRGEAYVRALYAGTDAVVLGRAARIEAGLGN